jgi:hypothetical protein
MVETVFDGLIMLIALNNQLQVADRISPDEPLTKDAITVMFII